MTDQYTLEIDGRELSYYLPKPLGDGSGSVYWVMRIGACDVGTDIRADVCLSGPALQAKLVEWYRRKEKVFEHCWESSDDLFNSGRLSADQRRALREHAAAVRAEAQSAAQRCAELVKQQHARVSHFEAMSGSIEQTIGELRAHMQQFGGLLRALETPPHRAILQLRNVVNEVVPAQEAITQGVREDAVRWGILAYYGEGDAA